MPFPPSYLSLFPFLNLMKRFLWRRPPLQPAAWRNRKVRRSIPLAFCLLRWLYCRDMSGDMGWGQEAQTLL